MSVPHMTPATFDAAERLCRAFETEENVAAWATLNWQFHSCLYEDARRPLLMATIRSLNDRLERYLRVQLTLSDGQSAAAQEHWRILDACRRGNAQGASDLIHAHIMGASSSLHHHLPPR